MIEKSFSHNSEFSEIPILRTVRYKIRIVDVTSQLQGKSQRMQNANVKSCNSEFISHNSDFFPLNSEVASFF